MKITLEEWAARNYSAPTSRATLSKWRREGQIFPPPERKWPHWMVEPDAKRVVDQFSQWQTLKTASFTYEERLKLRPTSSPWFVSICSQSNQILSDPL